MRTVLLAGDFKGLGAVFNSVAGARLVHCHSLDSLRNEWAKKGVLAVVLAVRELSPAMFELIREGQQQTGIKWVIFVQRVGVDLEGYNTDRQLFFQGQLQKGWAPRLRRFLLENRLDHRRADRRSCKGGVRVGDSDFSRQPTGAKAYGHIRNLSKHGLGLVFEKDPPFPPGEFLEVAFRDPEGAARTFHAQIRWKKPTSDGQIEVGLHFLAAG